MIRKPFRSRPACHTLALAFVLMGFSAAAETPYGPQGGEYRISGPLRGDQTKPSLSLNPGGGYLVWQDNITDGDGLGISARRLGPDFAGAYDSFRVNVEGAGEQENPRVTLTKSGWTVFVWQGGPLGAQHIYARFMRPDGTFSTGDLLVNTYVAGPQSDPAITELANNEVAITWSSYGQDGSMQGIYGQLFTSSGRRLGSEFQVNQYTLFNQRQSAVASLARGNFAVIWVSEYQTYERSADIYARLFDNTAHALAAEFRLNDSTNLCGSPAIVALDDGGFMAAWAQRDIGDLANGWDIFARAFAADGQPAGPSFKVNTHDPGNHIAPQLAAIGRDILAVWTSFGQDGSREGVFGRFLRSAGAPNGPEFQVNTYSESQQFQPAVASDGVKAFVAVWSSFVGGSTSFDLLAQRYAPSALKPAPPFVSALSSSALSITWPDVGNAGIAAYELYTDVQTTPVPMTTKPWTVNGLAPSSAHTFQIDYLFADGSRSPISETATGRTWGPDSNFDGLPDDWEQQYFGSDASQWPDPNADSDGDGATNLQEFLAGTNPLDPKSVLKLEMIDTPQGRFLRWNTQPGFVYQVQSKTDLTDQWSDVGSARFAADSTDSTLVPTGNPKTYYRVKRLR